MHKRTVIPVFAVLLLSLLFVNLASADSCTSCSYSYSGGSYTYSSSSCTSCCQQACTNTPPYIEIPDYQIYTYSQIGPIDLWEYAGDNEDSDSDLSFSIISQVNPHIVSCRISENRYLLCTSENLAGYSDITVKVSDSGGLYSADTFRVTVEQEKTEHNPAITSFSIEPDPATAYDDINCIIRATDEDSNLEYARFRWYVNGHIVKTQDISIQGGRANVQATLYSEHVHQGDTVKCDVTVYDSAGLTDSRSASIVIEYDQPCSVDVHGLSYTDNHISAYIKNTGIYREEISYTITIDDITKMTGHVSLDSGEEQEVSYEYHFSEGNHDITFTALTDCGYADRESIWYQVLEENYNNYPNINFIQIIPRNPEENDNLICNADVSDSDGDLESVRFFWYVNSNLVRVWETTVRGSHDVAYDTLDSRYTQYGDIVKCRTVASDVRGHEDSMNAVVLVTAGGQGPPYVPYSGTCGISITGIDYNDWIIAGNTEYVKVTVKNTGDSNQYVNAKIYMDGYMKASSSHMIYSGKQYTYVFGFPVNTDGKHELYVFVSSGCGAYDSKRFDIEVEKSYDYSDQCNHNGICDAGETHATCPSECPEALPSENKKETSVRISPLSFDIIQHRSKAIIIDIYSKQKQKFSITASGIPEQWLSYNKIEEIDGSKKVYIYVTPKTTGSYTISVEVKALSENKEFTSNIDLFVTLPDIKVIGKESDKPNGFAAFWSWCPASVFAYLLIVLLLIVLVVLSYTGFRLLSKNREDRGMMQPVYPYTQGIRNRVVPPESSGQQQTAYSPNNTTRANHTY